MQTKDPSETCMFLCRSSFPLHWKTSSIYSPVNRSLDFVSFGFINYQKMDTRHLIYALMLFLFQALCASCSEESAPPPNIVIIQLDDLGYDDLSIHGNHIVESPNIDSMGYTGMRFDQFYVNPVCAPTRASLLTGRHFMKTGVTHVHGGKDFLSLDETTIADVLRKAGYHTGMWGKWHSGHAEGYFPWQRGFDEAYMAQLYKHRDSRGSLNGKPVEHKKWADQVITEYAIDFMDRYRDEPFFAYLSFLSVHAPLDTPDSLRNKYMEKGMSYNLATIYGMVEHVDYYLGKLFTAIDSMELNRNTVIFFMSDNGPAVLNRELTDEDRKIRYVNGMKGHKGNIWENGVRSPLFAKWQGVTQPVVNYELVDVTDILPTIMELAGTGPSDEMKPLDGESFAELIRCGCSEPRGKISFNMANRGWPPTDQPWTPEGVLDEYRPVPPDQKAQEVFDDQIISVRRGAFKLLHHPGEAKGTPEQENGYVLVDILADPGEEVNLYDEMPDIAAELELLMKNWWESVLEAPASFSMPVFTVEGAIGDTSIILGKAPVETSENVKSAFAWLTHWTEPGDFARYNVHVKDPGLYEVSIIYRGRPNGARVKFSGMQTSVSNTIETYDRAILGSLELDSVDQVVELELMENPAGSDVFNQLQRIELQRK